LSTDAVTVSINVRVILSISLITGPAIFATSHLAIIYQWHGLWRYRPLR